MAIDPNIALGFRPMQIEQRNPMAEYAQLAQIQNYQNQNTAFQNQNALAQYQLGAAQRADQTATTQNELYARHFDPNTGSININAFVADAAQRGQGGIIPPALKSENERMKSAADLKKTTTETESLQFKLNKDKLSYGLDSLTSAPTPQDAIKKLNDGVTKGFFDFQTAQTEVQKLQTMTPEDYQKYRIERILGLVDAKDKLGFMLPKVARQDIGGSIVNIQDNPMQPGYGLLVAGMPGIAKTQTFADKNSSATLRLAQDKFAFEKANPAMSIQEDPTGFLAVNTRTGVATPVVYGPMGFKAAPANAPGDVRVAGQQVGSKKEAPAKFNDTDLQLAGLAGSLKEFKDEVAKNKTTGAKFLFSGQDTTRMTAKYTALLMGVKDLYTLGALTGPDMSIIESQITNPASWSAFMTSKEGFEAQTKVIEDMLKRSTTNLETTYSRVPKASRKALETLLGSASGISGATANDPLGLGIR